MRSRASVFDRSRRCKTTTPAEYASVRRYRACKIDMVYVRDGCGTNFVRSDGTCTSGEPVTDIEWQLTTKHIFPDKRCAVVFLALSCVGQPELAARGRRSPEKGKPGRVSLQVLLQSNAPRSVRLAQRDAVLRRSGGRLSARAQVPGPRRLPPAAELTLMPAKWERRFSRIVECR